MTQEQIKILEAISEIEEEELSKFDMLSKFFGVNDFNIRDVPAFNELIKEIEEKRKKGKWWQNEN